MTEETEERTVAEMWPDHAEHTVIYSETGRTDYVLRSLELIDDYDGVQTWSSNDHDDAPIDCDIQSTEIWCRDCGVLLPDQFPKEET